MFFPETHTSTFSLGDITIQSMTNTDTNDIEATMTQCWELYKAGCRVIRISVPGKKEVIAFQRIAKELKEKNCTATLVADIHYHAQLALEVAPFADKVRINPGNFLSESELNKTWEDQLILIHERLKPLVEVCKEHNTKIRIGLNGGSVYKGSGQLLTQNELIEQLNDYVDIFQHLEFHDLVLSIKMSNARNCIEVNEMLAVRAQSLKWPYPIHVGVTESGNGIEGRVKSFWGIGRLVNGCIGDTIRFSLAEDPVQEVVAAKALLKALPEIQKMIARFDHWSKMTNSIQFIHEPLDQAILVNGKARDLIPDHLKYMSVSFEDLQDELEDQVQRKERWPILLDVKTYDQNDGFIASQTLLIGDLLKRGMIHGICIDRANEYDKAYLSELYSNIIQVTTGRQMHSSITACPGCSRNRIDLEYIVNELKLKYSERHDLSFSVMGCSVNGYGEMMHSDIGIVGKINGKLDVYLHQDLTLKNVDQAELLVGIDHLLERKKIKA